MALSERRGVLSSADATPPTLRELTDVEWDRQEGAVAKARPESLEAIHGAIAYEDDVTEADTPFADVARSTFAELGSPGGAANAPRVPDPPFVVALPSQPHDDA